MKRALKPIPKFKTETEERVFWETHGSTEYVDWSPAQRVRFPNLKPSTQAISLRLPVALLEQIKVEANRRDVPYQSLIKVWLTEKAEQGQGAARGLTSRSTRPRPNAIKLSDRADHIPIKPGAAKARPSVAGATSSGTA